MNPIFGRGGSGGGLSSGTIFSYTSRSTASEVVWARATTDAPRTRTRTPTHRRIAITRSLREEPIPLPEAQHLLGAVVGVEGEWTDSTAKSDRYDLTDQFGFGRVSQGRDLYIGARAGILANPATLVYVKGGYTNSKLNILAGNTDETTDRSFKLDGWRIGAGVERAINTNTFAKLEYRYSNYTNANIDYMDGATSADFDVDTDRHQVVASVGWRF